MMNETTFTIVELTALSAHKNGQCQSFAQLGIIRTHSYNESSFRSFLETVDILNIIEEENYFKLTQLLK